MSVNQNNKCCIYDGYGGYGGGFGGPGVYGGYGGPGVYGGYGGPGVYGGGFGGGYSSPQGYDQYNGWYGGYGSGYGIGGYGSSGWLWGLLILIVIVLQFSRNKRRELPENTLSAVNCCNTNTALLGLETENRPTQAIDNSLLFIIIIFLLIICSCRRGFGGYGGYW